MKHRAREQHASASGCCPECRTLSAPSVGLLGSLGQRVNELQGKRHQMNRVQHSTVRTLHAVVQLMPRSQPRSTHLVSQLFISQTSLRVLLNTSILNSAGPQMTSYTHASLLCLLLARVLLCCTCQSRFLVTSQACRPISTLKLKLKLKLKVKRTPALPVLRRWCCSAAGVLWQPVPRVILPISHIRLSPRHF